MTNNKKFFPIEQFPLLLVSNTNYKFGNLRQIKNIYLNILKFLFIFRFNTIIANSYIISCIFIINY
jgi:hypothetical protein